MIDLTDPTPSNECETVQRAPRGEFPVARLGTRKLKARRGKVFVPVRCVEKKPCRVRVGIAKGARVSKPATVTVPRGATRLARVRSTARGSVQVRLAQTGVIGPRTSTTRATVTGLAHMDDDLEENAELNPILRGWASSFAPASTLGLRRAGHR